MTDVIPKEALAYLKSKKLKPGFDYRDVWLAEHNAAFTVAKMLQLDMLADVKEALEIALEEGQTFKQFAEGLKPYLIKKGWWGKQLIDDPATGETRAVQLGSDARLETIYRTNMRTARAAGQWERIERSKATHPYLLYELGPSREHRQEHLGWRGILLPADHPWWQTHMPPNGWGCKCRVRQVSQREADRLKDNGISAREQQINEETGLPTGRFTDKRLSVQTQAPKIKTRTLVNKRTGEVEKVPQGIDPGWNYNPGSRQAMLEKQLKSKQQALRSDNEK